MNDTPQDSPDANFNDPNLRDAGSDSFSADALVEYAERVTTSDTPDPDIVVAEVVSSEAPTPSPPSSHRDQTSPPPALQNFDSKSTSSPGSPPPPEVEIVTPVVVESQSQEDPTSTAPPTATALASHTMEDGWAKNIDVIPPPIHHNEIVERRRQPPSDLIEPFHTPDRQPSEAASPKRSWVFRFGDSLARFVSHVFGIASVLLLLAVAASIPLVQFLSFGYLLEVSGRLARGQKLRDAMVGLRKASRFGGIVLGVWLCLLPIRLISGIWFDAFLIDPNSTQTALLRLTQFALISLTVIHIAAAMMCGGKLRYFFWPLVAPVSLGIWSVRKLAGVSGFRQVLDVLLGWISPTLSDDICNTAPINDWFLPAIVWGRIRSGNFYVKLRDDMWEFVVGLRLEHYFVLGAKGFGGTLLWLAVPTTLLVISSYTEGFTAGLTFLAGVIFAIPIFAGLPFIQTHFARDGQIGRFLEPWNVYKNFRRSPMAHVVSLLIVLVLALPLFLLKIENIPSELMWTLSLVFVMFSWPAKVAVGLAYRRGTRRETMSSWWWRYPWVLAAMPVSFAFVLIFAGTRYVSWHGALSLFENHVFLLPAPFWL